MIKHYKTNWMFHMNFFPMLNDAVGFEVEPRRRRHAEA